MSSSGVMKGTIEDSIIQLWFSMLKELRTGSISYSDIVDREKIRPPVHRICKLIGVENLSDIDSEEMLYRTVVRVGHQMESEPFEERDKMWTEKLEESDTFCTTSTLKLSDAEMFRRVGKGVTAHRPKGLSAILDLVINSESQGDRKYHEFLQLANTAQLEVGDSCIAISPSYMYTALEPIKKFIENSSLFEIFTCYSKVRDTSYKLLDMPQHNEQFEAMLYLPQLVQFTRDFEICPRLMSEDDFRTICSFASLRSHRNGQGHFQNLRGLKFHDFQEVIVRIALFAYHKPTAKDLILRLNNGLMPSHIELVEYLCRYLHLDDQNWVMKQLQQTVGERKVPERCTFGKSEGKIVWGAERKQNQDRKVPIHKPLTIIKEKEKRKLKGKELHSVKTSHQISRPRSALPESVESLFREKREEKEERAKYIAESTNREENEEAEEQDNIVLPPPSTIHNTGITEEQRHLISSDMGSATLKCLKKYSFTYQKELVSQWRYPDGNFIDMGCLKAGTECVIKLKITNRSADEIFLDTSCIGFDSGDTRIVTEPAALVPGLSRTIMVLFTVEPGDRAVVANIEVYVACVRTALSYHIGCPVHYRVGPPNPDRDDFPCTRSNISQLLSNATGQHETKTLNFETKRNSREKSNRFGTMTFNTNKFNETKYIHHFSGSIE